MTAISLPITLAATGAAAIINVWIALRAGRARTQGKVSIGDGGNLALIARMRAHANFVEYTPFVLLLTALIELNIGSPLWLWAVIALFLLGRVLHPLGMDGLPRARFFGTIVTLLTLFGLGVFAVALPFTVSNPKASAPIEMAPAKG